MAEEEAEEAVVGGEAAEAAAGPGVAAGLEAEAAVAGVAVAVTAEVDHGRGHLPAEAQVAPIIPDSNTGQEEAEQAAEAAGHPQAEEAGLTPR